MFCRLICILAAIVFVFTGECKIAFASEESPDTQQSLSAITSQLAQEEPQIELNDSFLDTMQAGEKQKINIKSPSWPVDDFSFFSSNPSVAEVSSTGVIHAKSGGSSQITVSASGALPFTADIFVEEVYVSGIDLGEYETSMTVGSAQLLVVTALPNSSSDFSYVYASSNVHVATINDLGRIRALNEGETTITVSHGDIKESFILKVSNPASGADASYVSDIDLGDYQSTMIIKTSQLLEVTAIPNSSAEIVCDYDSSNEKIATINGTGRIYAHRRGITTITVSCGGIERSFVLQVKEKETEEDEHIDVQKIEVSEFKKEMFIDDVQNIVAAILPVNAAVTTIEYTSSNPDVATVTQGGKVTANGKGKTIITLSADGIEHDLNLEVRVKTARINLNKTYLTMKIAEQFQIAATVIPETASQELTFLSLDPGVAEVSPQGTITAQQLGRTSILVKNKDSQATVTVIVNTESLSAYDESVKSNAESGISSSDFASVYHSIPVELLLANTDAIILDGYKIDILDKDTIKYLRNQGKDLTLSFEDYQIFLPNESIKNIFNEFVTKANIAIEDEQVSITLNNGNDLPGRVYISLTDYALESYKYIYRYNQKEQTYQTVKKTLDEHGFAIDDGMTYIFTNVRNRQYPDNLRWIIGISGGAGALLIIAYLCSKRFCLWRRYKNNNS